MSTSTRFVIDDQHMDTVTLLSDPDNDEDDGEDELFNRDDGLSYDNNNRSSELEQMHIDDGLYSITPPSVTYRIAMTTYVWVATGMAALGGVLFGYDMGIVSGALLQLKPTFNLSCFQQEMVVSSMLVGGLIGSIVGGFIIDYFGRRLTIIGNSLIFISGAIILASAHSYTVLVLGRVVVGFAMSLSAVAECIYISEISPVKRRGQLVSLNEFGITVGILLVYLVNFIFISTPHGWRYMFVFTVIPVAIQGIGMVFLPPSPRFLVQKGRDNEAHAVLQRLRGTSNVEGELNNIRSSLMSEQIYSVFDLLRSTDNMRGRMMIGVGLVCLQHLTGQVSVLYYAPSVFQALGFESNTSATLATVGLGFVKVLATIASILTVDKVGRRSLLLLGATCMMLVTFALGLITIMIPPIATNPCSTIQLQPPTLASLNITDTPIQPNSVQQTYRNRNSRIPYRFRRSVEDHQNSRYLVHSISEEDANTKRTEINAMNFLLPALPRSHQNIVQFYNLDSEKENLSNHSISYLLHLLKLNVYDKDRVKDQMGELSNDSILKEIKSQLHFVNTKISNRSLSRLDVKTPQKDQIDERAIMQLYSELSSHVASSVQMGSNAMNSRGKLAASRRRRSSNDENTLESSTVKNYNIASADASSTVQNSAVSESNGAKGKENELNDLETGESGAKVTTASPKKLTTSDGNKVIVSTTTAGITTSTGVPNRGGSDNLPDMLQKQTSGAVKAVALIAMMCYIAAYAIGFGPVTWLILSEIFPAGIRGRAASFASIFNFGTNIIVSATFLDILSSIGTSWTFLSYSAVCALSVIFIFLLIPETKNKSLEQISMDLKKGTTLGRVFARCRHRTSCTLLCCCQLSISHSRLPVSESQSDFITSTNQVTVSNTRL